jgi:hypothetical protein
MSASTLQETRVEEIPGIKQPEATALAESQNRALLHTLYSLDDEQWAAPTDCVGWSVKDIAAHKIGRASCRERVSDIV